MLRGENPLRNLGGFWGFLGEILLILGYSGIILGYSSEAFAGEKGRRGYFWLEEGVERGKTLEEAGRNGRGRSFEGIVFLAALHKLCRIYMMLPHNPLPLSATAVVYGFALPRTVASLPYSVAPLATNSNPIRVRARGKYCSEGLSYL